MVNLRNEFEIPIAVDEAWITLLDVERIVTCVPGAELVERTGKDAYRGRITVQLGPITIAFDGTANFTRIDERERCAWVHASGADKKGRGGAVAKVVFRLEPIGASSRVLIDTDLQLSGSIAQYGRASGLIADVAKELILRFAQNLRTEIQNPSPTATTPGAPSESAEHRDASAAPIPAVRLVLRVIAASIARGVHRIFSKR